MAPAGVGNAEETEPELGWTRVPARISESRPRQRLWSKGRAPEGAARESRASLKGGYKARHRSRNLVGPENRPAWGRQGRMEERNFIY